MGSIVETLIPLIPKEILFGNPWKANPQISPDGRLLSFLAPVNGVLNIWVGPVDGDDYRPVTQDTDRGIRSYLWSFSDNHLIYLQDVGGDENWRLYITDLEKGETRDLTPFPDVRAIPAKVNRNHPDSILVMLNRDNPELYDVYRITLSTGEMEKVAENPGNVISWSADEEMNIRLAVTITPRGGHDLLVRDAGESEWRPIVSWSPEDAGTSGPLGFNRDGNTLYLIDSRNANAGRLVTLDLSSGNLDAIFADDRYDVTEVFRHHETREPLMAGVLRERLEWHVMDESVRDDMEFLKGLDPGDLHVASRTRDDDFWVVRFDAPDSPLRYYLYDRAARTARFLFTARPDLEEYVLAPMEPFSYETEDGLTVHGYLTFPPGEERKNLPMVLNVHGGPWVRDTWGFDPEAQWFANRGYICMQLNYRGSAGYGKEFGNAGDKEWGGKMHDDLVQGVAWAVEQGYADPERVAIYGGSYGGYAALVGATFTPDLFRCAVAIVGPSNLVTFINSIPPYWRPLLEQMHRRVGNPETEAEFLMSRSPITYVDRIAIPMLIAQGANDPRVKQAESEQIVAAMKSKGIPHQYMLFEDEGHGFAKPENRMTFYAAVERFLAEHLGGRSEEANEA